MKQSSSSMWHHPELRQEIAMPTFWWVTWTGWSPPMGHHWKEALPWRSCGQWSTWSTLSRKGLELLSLRPGLFLQSFWFWPHWDPVEKSQNVGIQVHESRSGAHWQSTTVFKGDPPSAGTSGSRWFRIFAWEGCSREAKALLPSLSEVWWPPSHTPQLTGVGEEERRDRHRGSEGPLNPRQGESQAVGGILHGRRGEERQVAQHFDYPVGEQSRQEVGQRWSPWKGD